HRIAVALLKRLVTNEPNNLSAWQNLAVGEFELGRFDDALESSRQALKLAPANRAVLHNLIVGCDRAGDFDQGIIWVGRALSLSPNDPALHRLSFRLRALRMALRVRQLLRRVF